MPSLTFVMPHWLYWCALIVFPLVAIWLVKRQQRNPPDARPSLFIAYLFWLCSGFLGIHRFYLRSAWGFIFIPVFAGVLYCNDQIRDVREDDSRTHAELQMAQLNMERARPAEQNATAEDKAAFERTQAEVKDKEALAAVAHEAHERWYGRSRSSAVVLALMLLGDAILLPGLVRRRRALELAQPEMMPVHPDAPELHEGGIGEDPTMGMHTRFTDAIEWVNVRLGHYVAYWGILAVFAYYYEVLARFVFNSPTNWVHESMFLMFGMQYMLCGAFAYREDQHVRVDVIYAKFSRRGKAIADIITSVFFFIFVGALFVTAANFAWDSIQFGEHSFTEWGIEYWPVKLTMPIGAGLLLLQGVSKLIKDVLIVTHKGA
jgi:TRAP-type mannitol/chloroaromatic compound transport system permease small subunit